MERWKVVRLRCTPEERNAWFAQAGGERYFSAWARDRLSGNPETVVVRKELTAKTKIGPGQIVAVSPSPPPRERVRARLCGWCGLVLDPGGRCQGCRLSPVGCTCETVGGTAP